MTKEEKLIILNKIKELIPLFIYICTCYNIVRDLPAFQFIKSLTTNSMKNNIPELYKEILNEIDRTRGIHGTYSSSFISTSILYSESDRITNRIALIDRIINKIKNN